MTTGFWHQVHAVVDRDLLRERRRPGWLADDGGGEPRVNHARASSMEPKRCGNSGRYFNVLNWLSE